MRPAGWSFLWVALLGAVCVRHADGDSSIDITCQDTSVATLIVQNNYARYECNGGNGGNNVSMETPFVVNVNARNLTLNLSYSNVTNITFTNGLDNDIPTLDSSGMTFQEFGSMSSLRFENFSFDPGDVTFDISNSVREIHFVNSNMTDLHLPQNFSSLTVIDLDDTTFNKIPAFLYEREYTNNVTITVDLSSASEKVTLISSESSNLENNVDRFSSQSWAQQYRTLCDLDIGSTISKDEKTFSCSSNRSDSSSSMRDYTEPTGSFGSSDANAGDDSSSGVSTGALVAIIVVVVLIAVVLAFFILRMYFRRKAANANSHNNDATATLMSKGDATADKGSFISNDEFLRNFRLPQSDVALVKSLGTGRLWMGEYNNEKVVVKRVESEVTDSYVTKALMAQARTFATISHPNITNLVGVTWLAGTDFAVVTEFMDKGNLKTVLANTDVDLDVTTKLQMCCDIALALAYLHETEQNLCAKQLSSRKVLVNKTMSCKLSIFECVPCSAKFGGPNTTTMYSYGMGEVAWLPPEVITRSSPMDARKNNIYAFGVLVSEIFTRVTPYQSLVEKMGNTMSDVELVSRVRRQELLVPHENRRDFLEAPTSVRQLVEQCLSYAPMSRPSAKDVVEILHNAKEELATNSI